MLVSTNPGPDFSRGYALPLIADRFLATHPPPQFANGSMPAPCPVILAAANLFIHRSNILCLAASCLAVKHTLAAPSVELYARPWIPSSENPSSETVWKMVEG